MGFVVLLGIEEADTAEDIEWLSGKISRLRVFTDAAGQMNLGLQEVNGEVMVISQFTLHASTRKGNRPSFTRAATPAKAEQLYREFILRMESDSGKKVHTGVFGDHMDVSLVNDGPVTVIIDTKNKE
jgi:D-tyrosyl-tRNA(Tyr) deacylase